MHCPGTQNIYLRAKFFDTSHELLNRLSWVRSGTLLRWTESRGSYQSDRTRSWELAMSGTNPKVDACFSKTEKWREELETWTQSCRGTRGCRVVAANELVCPPIGHSSSFRHAMTAIAESAPGS